VRKTRCGFPSIDVIPIASPVWSVSYLNPA
jgi:hypothetical protein